MKKIVICCFIFLLGVLSFADSFPVDDEIKKLTKYAEDYESGSINYAQLVVYISSVRQNLNEELGAVSMEEGGLFKEQQIESALGEPRRTTKWVWVESEEREKKLNEEVPVWEKIIFDGKKIQIRINAHPSVFRKKEVSQNSEEVLIYRLNFDIMFKSPSKEVGINSKIDEIKDLAERFSEDPSRENAEVLAGESVNVERAFESSMRQSQNSCEDVMTSIFGSENLRGEQKMLVSEIEFFSGENFESRIRLEMCDDCDWNWINLNMWVEGRGRGFEQKEEEVIGNFDRRRYEGLESSEYESKIREIIERMRLLLEEGNYKEAQKLNFELQMINEAWNEEANNIWEEIDEIYQGKRGDRTPEEEEEFNRNYGWIREEQERREREKELRRLNYEDRKDFYEELFSGYDKKEFYFNQVEYEKRLIEEFAEFGEEMCSNNVDDNDDGKIDCADNQCGGKFCGETSVEMVDENGEVVITTEKLYCIAGSCQEKKEEVISSGPVCGNNICETGENVCSPSVDCEGDECFGTADCGIAYCPNDCSICEEHPSIECDGRVVFGGEDVNGCPLPPVCISEEEVCQVTEDCIQPLCGLAECIKENSRGEFGICKTTELRECLEADCKDRDEKKKECDSGEIIISEVCSGGMWRSTGLYCGEKSEESLNCVSCGDSCAPAKDLAVLSCPSPTVEFECIEKQGRCEVLETSKRHNSCVIKGDCGGKNDVCSNGECVTLPEIVSINEPAVEETYFAGEDEKEIEEPEKDFGEFNEGEEIINEEDREEDNGVTDISGQVIRVIKVVTGRIISGFASHEGEETDSGNSGNGEDSSDNSGPNPGENPNDFQNENFNEFNEENFVEEGRHEERFEEEREGDDERRFEEQKNRCEEDCSRFCVDNCVREECREDFECDVDSVAQECGTECSPEESCIEKCMSGENFWEDYQDEQNFKYEKGVFMVGGSCRDSPQEEWGSNGNIHFGGWGVPFEEIQPLKNKYYQGGGSDWCKNELNDLIRQRSEFEKSVNEKFVVWFFENYLSNSAEDFEKHISGIFELYWKDVELSREIAYRMQCLGVDELPEFKLIEKIEYETPFGKFEFWEEMKEANLPGIDEKVKLISPYMKAGIFPNKEFMKSIMQKSMKEGKFPGPPEENLERENQGGPTEEERMMIKQDKKFMAQIIKVSEKYGGEINAVVQFKDLEKDEIVFNLYARVNPEVIMELEPMPYSEVPSEDFRIEIDFDKVYDMILTTEKEMQAERLESPPWDQKKVKPVQKVKEIKDGVQIYFKMRSIINSANVYPENAESDAKDLFKLFFKMMQQGDDRRGPSEGGERKDEGEGGRRGESNQEDFGEFGEGSQGEDFEEEFEGGLFG